MAKDEKQCDTGLDGRCRDNDGEIRQKRGDTLVRPCEKHTGRTLHQEFAVTLASILCANALRRVAHEASKNVREER